MAKFENLCRDFQYLSSKAIKVGVLNAEPETIEAAVLNEFGGTATYNEEPFRGETVKVPARSFIQYPSEKAAEKAFKETEKFFREGMNRESMDKLLDYIGEMVENEQKKALETNGSNVPNWVKHNDPRTIAIKGFDRPLWSRRNETFPISREVTDEKAS